MRHAHPLLHHVPKATSRAQPPPPKKKSRSQETPDFFYYALADGLRLMFARHGRWTRYAPDEPSPQLEFALDWG